MEMIRSYLKSRVLSVFTDLDARNAAQVYLQGAQFLVDEVFMIQAHERWKVMGAKKQSLPIPTKVPMRIILSYKNSLTVARNLDEISKGERATELKLRMWNFIASIHPEVRGAEWAVRSNLDYIYLEKESK